MQVEKFAVVELIHYVDLTTDRVFARFIWGLQEFAHIVPPRGFLNHSMNYTERPAGKRKIENKTNWQLKTWLHLMNPVFNYF